MSANTPQPFLPGFRTIDGSELNEAFADPLVASQDGITAHAGGGKANAYQLTTQLNRVTTVATTADSVKLPEAIPGTSVTLINAGANAMQVFGKDSDTINGVATGTGISQPAGTEYVYHCLTDGAWRQYAQGGSGSFTGTFDGVVGGTTPAAGTFTTTSTSGNSTTGGYNLRSVGNALTAAGTTRADALQLAKEVNNVTTAAASTGVLLPVGVVGMRIVVFNGGANTIQVYGAGSETIDGVAGATGVPLTNAKRCEYFFVAANTWVSAQLGVVSA